MQIFNKETVQKPAVINNINSHGVHKIPSKIKSCFVCLLQKNDGSMSTRVSHIQKCLSNLCFLDLNQWTLHMSWSFFYLMFHSTENYRYAAKELVHSDISLISSNDVRTFAITLEWSCFWITLLISKIFLSLPIPTKFENTVNFWSKLTNPMKCFRKNRNWLHSCSNESHLFWTV